MIEVIAGVAVASARPVPGGDINAALRCELADGRVVFVKHRPDPPRDFYAAEAAGLDWLRPGPLRVPAVLQADDAFLALEWIEPGPRAPGFDAALGRGLAGLHALGADGFGAARLYVGPLDLSGSQADWPATYGALLQRLDPGPAVRRVIDRLDILCGPPEPPARLHGDLWTGNVMAGPDGAPWLIDPAAYGGHREIDLAMLGLFGAPSPALLAAYREVSPLAEGHAERVGLYQLLPLLVHARLFGGGYGAAAERAARAYL